MIVTEKDKASTISHKNKIQFSKNLIKGKIAEMIFEQML